MEITIQEILTELVTRYNFYGYYALFGIMIILTIGLFMKKVKGIICIPIDIFILLALMSGVQIITAFIEWGGWYLINTPTLESIQQYNMQFNIIFLACIVMTIMHIGIIFYSKIKK